MSSFMSSFTIVVHPDNLELTRNSFRKCKEFVSEIEGVICIRPTKSSLDLALIRFHGESSMERTKETGKFVLPGGRVVPAEKVSVVKGFITYGPEDLSWLLYAGIVTPEVIYPSYMINDRFDMDSPVFDPDISFVPPPKLEWKVTLDVSPTMFRYKFS